MRAYAALVAVVAAAVVLVLLLATPAGDVPARSVTPATAAPAVVRRLP